MKRIPQRIVEPGGNADVAGPQGTGVVYRKPLLKLRWDDVKLLLAESVSGWNKHNAPRMGAALAFYALLSLMPLLLVVISVAGLVYGAHAAETGVFQQLQILTGEQRARIIQALLEGSQNRAEGLWATVLGTLTLMFGASGFLVELRAAMNTIWDVAPPRLTLLQELAGLVKERLWSLALVLAIVVLLTASLAFSTWTAAVGALATVLPGHEAVLHVLNAIFSFALVTGIFGAVYRVVPQVPIEWSDVILGAAVTSLLFTLGNLLVGLYLGRASFASTYGAAASTIVLAIWVYYSSQVFFLGAEFTKAFAQRYGSDPGRNPHQLSGASGASDAPSNPPQTLFVPGR